MIELGIKKPITALMLVLGIILFAVVALPRIPVELYPATEVSQVSIITRLRGGIAATEVEKYVTRPLEEAFSELNGLREIISSSRESESNITLFFYPDVNTNFVVIDIREKLAMVKHLLPREVEKPIIAKFQQSDAPIIILALSSNIYSTEKLREMAEEKIKEKIMRIAGVANVEIGGGRERKFLIEIINSKLVANRLPILSVVERINLNNISISAGDIIQTDKSYIIRATGEYKSIKEIENTGIAITNAGSVIRLKDIAVVRDSYYEPTSFARLNLQSVVSLYVQKESTANTIKVAEDVGKEVENLKRLVGKDVIITPIKNDATFINRAIRALTDALSMGGILLCGILFVFLRNVRTILIVITTLPLSLLMSFCMLFLSGLTFNVMTLSGLAMGIGNVMDNAIVILENISFHHHRKTFPDKISMIVNTLTFVPAECFFWQRKYDLDFQPWYLTVRNYYRKMLAFSFRYQPYVWAAVLGLLLFSASIFIRSDSEFIDPGDVNTFRIGIQFPPATKIEISNEIVKRLEKALMTYPNVRLVSSKVEKLHTFVEVEVKQNPEKFKEEFRKRFPEFSPAFVYFQESQAAGSKEVLVDFYGNDYNILKQLAFASSGKLSQVKGLTDIKIRMREDEPELHFFVDFRKLAIFGISTIYLANTLHCQLRGLIATQYRTEGKEIETICRLVPHTVENARELPFLAIVNQSGDILRLGQCGHVEEIKASQEIWHKNKKRFIQISANRLKMGLDQAAKKINASLKSIAFPKDYSFNLSGDYEKTVRNKEQFIFAIILTVILIYLVLASLFESYIQPLLIMFALPLSTIGVALSLWIFKKPISLGVWIGFMILFGSVVYGSIILVEKINTRRQGRKDLLKVIFEACGERLRPELITMLMKTLGLVPMILSRDEAATMWRSLGMTVFFGTITGTLLTLLLVPVAYLTAENMSSNIQNIIPWSKNAFFASIELLIKIFRKIKPRLAVIKIPLPKFPKRKEKEKQERYDDEF
ncbi:MAG: efflux RND transporter permease subunit [Elusimicrobia bacterium]|nr:efflux RND transporter permease subunit [Elusimicrobiota bacterium]